MISFSADLLKKKFSRDALPQYPDQESYPNLPDDTDGLYQPLMIGSISDGRGNVALIDKFAAASPCIPVDIGTETPPDSGVWRGRKFKIIAKITNPETGVQHGITPILSPSDITVIRYQDQLVTELVHGTHYTLSDAATQINMVSNSSGDLKDDAIIRATDFYYIDDAAGTFTGVPGNGITFLPHFLHLLLVCIGGVPTPLINIASFTQLGQIKQGVIGTFDGANIPPWAKNGVRGYHAEQIDLQTVIDRILFPNNLSIDLINGKHTLVTISDLTSITDKTLTDIDIANWKESYFTDTITNRIIVNYFQRPAGGETIAYFQNKRAKKKRNAKPITILTQAVSSKRNGFLTPVGLVNVVDDFGKLIGKENELVVDTYYENEPILVQRFADELYRRWKNGIWSASFTDISGTLLTARVGDRVIIQRKRSVHGDISKGKAYRIIEMTKNYSQNTTEVIRADAIV